MILAIHKTLSQVRRLCGDTRGSMVIETAFVAPMLILMSIGSFEVSRLVSRQHELQSGASEAEAIALAANMGAHTNTVALEAMLEESLGLEDNQVSVTKLYRCNTSEELFYTDDYCANDNNGQGADAEHGNDSDPFVSSYIRLRLTDSISPIWSKIGVGGDLQYDVERLVQLS